MQTTQIVRYGSSDLMIEFCGSSYTARVRKTITKEIVGEAAVGYDFNDAVEKAKKVADQYKFIAPPSTLSYGADDDADPDANGTPH
jgi:hypothetical protein